LSENAETMLRIRLVSSIYFALRSPLTLICSH